MYRGLSLARDTYNGFPLRPVRARPVVQPVAAHEPIEHRWFDGDARVSSLVGTLPRALDEHTHIFDLGMCITCNKRER